MKQIALALAGKPWLKIVNPNNMTSRLQSYTNGNAFLVYNTIQQNYELHTLEAKDMSGDSYNCSLDIALLNQFLIWDYGACNFKTHLDYVQSEKEKYEHHREKVETLRSDLFHEEITKSLRKVLGTTI